MSRIKFPPSNRIMIFAMILVILTSLFGAAYRPAAAADTTNLNIVSVLKGQSVTISVVDMPANKEFRVLMNVIGTQGVKGTEVGIAKTGKDGSFTKTFAIPSALKNEKTVAIRIEATDKTGWYAYNWFTNSTSGSSSGSSSSGSSSTAPSVVSSSGNLTILNVEEDVSVDVLAKNLSANRVYQVWFDWKSNNSVKTAQSGTLRTDQNGRIDETVRMPSVLRDRREIRLRLSSGTGVSASGWFYNAGSDEEVGGSAPSGYDGGIPYLVIGAVVKNDTVTVEVNDFPKKTELDVYMGKFGTQGEDGVFVETVKTGKSGSSFTVTLDIPSSLRNREKISIRFEGADNASYYAYSWFYNSTDSTGQ